MERWHPPTDTSPQEELLLKRLTKVRKLFAFLRLHRHQLFDDAFQEKLEGMYRDTGAGLPPCPPALLAMVTLLQGYVRASDAEAVELTVVDLRWQMVLGCLGTGEPPFCQATLQEFRERMIAHDMDRVLLEHSVALARSSKAADAKLVGQAVRAAFDSRPLTGAGRVEDTINLLGHAARRVAEIAARLLETTVADVCQRARTPLLLGSSLKASLDVDWGNPQEKSAAVEAVEQMVVRLTKWVREELEKQMYDSPLQPYIEAMLEVRAQDLHTNEEGKVEVRQEVAKDRRISIEDAEMRHGRKSSSQLVDGYKEHVGRDLDLPLILACAVRPANEPEYKAAEPLKRDIERQGLVLRQLSVDLGYAASPVVQEVEAAGGEVVVKPWPQRSPAPGMFSKTDFRMNFDQSLLTCPAGQTVRMALGEVAKFSAKLCGECPMRERCTRAKGGRSVAIAADEPTQVRRRQAMTTAEGRARCRERTQVEHALAHVAARKGPEARYVGCRRNLFDLRRAATLQNLEAMQRELPLVA